MGILSPAKEQFKAIMEMEDEGPIVMVNLLKFKPDGGAESYRTYGEKFTEFMAPVGVEIVYRGNCLMTAIGTEEWDEVIVVRYPSKAAFIDMNRNKEYQEIAKYRFAGLSDSRLFLTKEA